MRLLRSLMSLRAVLKAVMGQRQRWWCLTEAGRGAGLMAVLLAVLLFGAGTAWAASPDAGGVGAPRLAQTERGVELLGLPPVLGEAAVRRQLDSGLTATFALTITPTEGAIGGGRVEVRYELWDEVYLTRAIGVDGSVVGRSLENLDALQRWWQAVRLPVLAEDARFPVRLRLDLVPFSEAEEADTRRWLASSMDAGGDVDAEGLRGESGGGESLGQVFNVLMATSIRRRAVFSEEWAVAAPLRVPPAAEPSP